MEDYSEKRAYERYDYDTDLQLRRYDTKEYAYEANMGNYSRQGMYFTTKEKLNIGQEVYIKIQNYNPDSDGPEQYRSYTGYVKWSEDLGTSIPNGQYGYGVQYAEPVYY